MKTTILDVAERSGFSKSTVSLALQGSEVLRKATREQILSVAEEMGYSSNAIARSLKTGVSHLIGLVVPDILNPYFADVSQRIEKYAYKAGFDLMISTTDLELEREKLCIDRMVERRLDGAIMFLGKVEQLEKHLLNLRKNHFPCILIGPSKRNVEIDSIFVNQETGTYSAIEHLVKMGHRNIIFICGMVPEHDDISERINGYKKALADHNIDFNEDLMINCGFEIEDGYRAALDLFKARPRPTAIFALNDLLAIGVIRGAIDAGLKVPEDVSVVGVDNISLGRFVQPSLTTVATPIKEIASSTVKLLIRRIKNKQWEGVERIFLESKLIIRESTGQCKNRVKDLI